MVNDSGLKNVILIIDGLDECNVDRPNLLEFITKPLPVKWIVSSRNWLDIQDALDYAKQKVKIHLEINQDSVSEAVNSFIEFKVDQLTEKKKCDDANKAAILEYLKTNSNGTFLWAALVCHELSNSQVRNWHMLDTMKSLPPGLDPLYQRMMMNISESKDAQLCKDIVAYVLIVYRPLTLDELRVLVEGLEDKRTMEVEEIIASCGSFLTIHNNVRDIYGLKAPGCLIDEVSVPETNPLAPIQYFCIFWADHLCESAADDGVNVNDRIMTFFKEKYLQWLEAISLLHSIYSAARIMEKLALIFSPTNSLTKQIYSHEEPNWIEPKPQVEENWDACLRTLEGHGDSVNSVVFSNDGQRLASGSKDETVKIWDATSGACLQTLEGHHESVESVVFSNDGQRLASGSFDYTVKIWDATSGACLQTLEGHHESVESVVFSNNGQRLASGSYDYTVKIWDATSVSRDETVKIWDATSGACLQTLEGHSRFVNSVVFSNDGQRLASGSGDSTVKIWDATSGACLQTLEGHHESVESVVFSNDGQRLASGSYDYTVKIWDATSGVCVQTLEGHDYPVHSVVFSNDGQRLASVSRDETVKIWDATSGACLQTLKGRHGIVDQSVFLNTEQSSSPLFVDKAPSFPSRSHSYSISEDDVWIMQNQQRVLWLPPSYRPKTSAFSSNTIVLVSASHHVTVIGFKPISHHQHFSIKATRSHFFHNIADSTLH
ncbi:Vegetative incompatibility protein HET-E-1 [Ceratocystis lukuohia]|uniref:Vegetative incompatibility protein HET-E-1 n=1 Tax=Ceratocystis lukuohia TaxID=2019550 RepID=A0ABR4MBE3_9PEZI